MELNEQNDLHKAGHFIGSLGKKVLLKRVVLPGLAAILPYLLLIIAIVIVIGGVLSFGNSIEDFFDGEKGNLGLTDDEMDEYLNDPQNVYDAITGGKLDLSNSNMLLMDEDTVERVFEHIIDYNEKRGETSDNIQYGDRIEVIDSTSLPFGEMDAYGEVLEVKGASYDTRWRSTQLRRSDVEGELDMDGKGIFDVRWQEIYVACAMAARDNVDDHSLKNDQDMATSDLDDLDMSEYYLTNEQIDDIINIFCYEFNYYFDPLKSAKSKYRFKSFINLNSAFTLDVLTWSETEWNQHTESYDVIAKRSTYRVPAAAPREIHNGYVKYTYNYTDGVCTSRDCIVDPNLLVAAMRQYVQEFDLEEFIEMLALLPGTEDLVQYYEGFEKTENGFMPIITSTSDKNVCTSIGVVYSPATNEGDGAGDAGGEQGSGWEDWEIESTDIIYYDYVKGNIHRIAVKEPGKDYGIYKLRSTALRSFMVSDGLTAEQLLAFFDSHPSFKNSGNVLFTDSNIEQTAQALVEVQNEEGVSIPYFLSIMTLEGAITTAMGDHWNYFNIEASEKYGRPPIPGHPRFADYSQIYSTPQEALKAEIRSIKTWYATNYNQTNAFLFCFMGYTQPDWSLIYHSYCPPWDDCSFPWAAGSGMGSPAGKGWPNNVGDYFYQYSLDLGLVTESGEASGETENM